MTGSLNIQAYTYTSYDDYCVIRTKTVVSAVFRVVLHRNTAKVVKNSSKVGLGDVDLMKCMYGSSVT